jgi:hypothetical protein
MAEHSSGSNIKPEDIHLPPSSFWPIVLAFGFSCIVGGAALNLAVAVIGIIITLVATIGWVIEPVHVPDTKH